MNGSQVTYRQNIDELEGIVKSIETGEVDLDVLATKVERAKTLIQACQRRLRTTKASVERIMGQVDDETLHDDGPYMHESFEDGQPAGLDPNEESLFSTCPSETLDGEAWDSDE